MPYRSSGSFAIPRAMTASNVAGTRGLVTLGRGGGEARWAATMFSRLSRENGLSPVSDSYSTHASEYTSTAGVASCSVNRSGAM